MLIKEYLNPNWGRAFKRISKAFREHSPDWLQWTDGDNYDLRLVHVVGGEEIPHLQYDLDKTIIVQHCYFTTYIKGWDSYWRDALLTVSFHNLPDYTDLEFSFYRMPWGADEKIFYYNNEPKINSLFVTGHVAETESIDEIYEAIRTLDLKFIHTGHKFNYDARHYKYLDYMTDPVFRSVLASTKYVAGLRKIEGFEMTCVEGLFCKARPIVFDLPTYDFYKGFAEFIDPNQDIIEQLILILKNEPREFTEEEYKEILNKFSWKNLIGNFYSKLLEVYEGSRSV